MKSQLAIHLLAASLASGSMLSRTRAPFAPAEPVLRIQRKRSTTVTTDVMDSPVGGLGAGRVDGLPSIAQNESHRSFLVMNPAEDRWLGVTAAPSRCPPSRLTRSNDGLAIAPVAVASSLTILCMRLFSRSIARRVSRVRRAIGFRGSTMSHSFKKTSKRRDAFFCKPLSAQFRPYHF
jgi:hypothetical protein